MASAIYFANRRINIPGAYSEIDASALAGVSPGAVGIVALVGTAEGGKPNSVETEYSDATRPETIRKRYRSGNLKDAGQFAFEPSSDPAVPGGASRVVAVKVNPALQSVVTFEDALGVDTLKLTAEDWGAFTNKINIEIAAGTTAGKKFTLAFEDITEIFDDIGAEEKFDLVFAPGANGYGTALASVSATQFTINGTVAKTGLSAERTADIAAPGLVDITSSGAGDTTQTVTVYGLSGTTPVSDTISLNGVATVPGTQSFSKVLGCVMSAVAVGTVLVRTAPAGATLFSMAPAVVDRALEIITNGLCNGVVTVASSADLAGIDMVVRGTNAVGTEVAELFDLDTALATPVVGTTVFASITQLELGDVAGGNTETCSFNMATTLHSSFNTVQSVVDYMNSISSAITANAVANDAGTYLMASLDIVTNTSVLTTAKDFFAVLDDIVTILNEQSQLVTAEELATGTIAPANTVSPVFMTGGTEGVSTFTEWTNAFTELKKRRVNIIVPLTQDPAVHALLLTQLIARAGILRSEANGYVGIGTALGAGETKTNIKTQIKALNTRHIAAQSQEPKRYNPDTGVNVFWPPWMYSVIAAGMQAGSSIGEPLTHKLPLVNDVRQDSSWTTVDDSEEMIDAGLMFSESEDGVGIRWVRSITTHLKDDNVVFTEVSANEAANTGVYEFRRRMELKIGNKGLGGSIAEIKGLANQVLQDLVDDEIIVDFRSLQVGQIADVFPVSFEMAPVLPINFIPTTVHLVATQVAAA